MIRRSERHGRARLNPRPSDIDANHPPRRRSLRALLTMLLTMSMVVGLANCRDSGPSKHEEHLGTVEQADTFDSSIPLELGHIAPTGPGPAEGYLPGASSVSASGSYEYAIPLDVPPGRAGMQPSLALTYTSGAGVNALGAGWSVAGATSIIRPCAPTFASNGGTGFPSKFCLDQQQLRPYGNGEFRTEKDSFAQIWAQPPAAAIPDSWEVRLKDGRIRTYKAIRYNGDKTRFWALDRESDRRGNAIRYFYDHQEYWDACTAAQKAEAAENPECAEPYTHFAFELARIEYTEGESEQPRRKVVFHYDPRDPQAKPTYIRMWDIDKEAFDFRDVSMQLGSIEMYGPTEGPWSGTPSLAWSYELTYTTSPDTGRPLMASVTKCSASNGCLLAREFAYSERSPSAANSYEVLWELVPPYPVVDSRQIRLLDGTGDGKDDVYLRRKQDLEADDPAGFADGYLYDMSAPPINGNPIHGITDDPPELDSIPVDLDGDGFVELVGTRYFYDTDPKKMEMWAYKSDMSEYHPWIKLPDTPPLWTDDSNVTGYYVHGWDQFRILFGDLDGDGLPDVCRERPSYTLSNSFPPSTKSFWTCALNLGSGEFGPWGILEHTTTWSDGNEYLADLDGDGRAEFHHADAAGGDSSNPGDVVLGDRDGDGFQEIIATSTSSATVGDFDGDGRDDVVDDATLTVDYAYPNPGAQEPSAHRAGLIMDLGTFRGDFNGDGRDDLLLAWIDGNLQTHLKAITMTGPDPDRLVEVRDAGADFRERVTYTREFAPGYDPRSCSLMSELAGTLKYPLACVRRGFSVVSRLESRTGTLRDRHFAYHDPTFDRRGRGFLGFNRIFEWQPDRPALLLTEFENKEPPEQGVYPGAYHPSLRLEIVPIIEQTLPGEPVDHVGSANARIKLTRYRYQLNKDPAFHGVYTIVPDPVSSWDSEEWEDQVTIDWDAWPHIPLWANQLFAHPAASKKHQGIQQYDAYGNLIFSWEYTPGGQHPMLGNLDSHVKMTTITYDLRPADWLIGLVDTVHVTAAQDFTNSSIREIKYVHDGSGLVESIERMPNGNAEEQQLITYGRDPRGLIKDVTATASGAFARVQHIAYDEEGVHPAQLFNDYGHSIAVQIHPTLAVPMVRIDANGVREDWWHDDLGRVRHTFPQAGISSAVTYAPWVENGLVQGTFVKVTREDASKAEIWLDDRGRTVTSRSLDFAGQWRSVHVERDQRGRVSSVERPHYESNPSPPAGTAFLYDSLDRVVSTILPDGNTRTSTYDLFEEVHKDALNNEETLTYDFDGRLVMRARHALPTSWDPGSTIYSIFEYEPFGQVKTIIDNGGNLTTMSYDHRGRVYQTIHPDQGTTTVHYNGHGEVQSVQTAEDTFAYTYDAIGRVEQVKTSEGLTEFVWDLSPNGIGKLSSTHRFDGIETSYTYEPNGRLKDVAWTIDGNADPFVISRTYDSDGRLQALEYPQVNGLGRTKIAYAYNAYGYMHQVTDVSPTVGSNVLWTIQARNEDDSLLEAQGGEWTTSRSYHPENGRLEGIKVVDTAPKTDLFDMTYHYDPNGAVDQREELVEGRREVFHMDGHHRLKEWELEYGLGGPNPGNRTSTYTYDVVDNLHEVSVTGSAISPYTELFTSGNGGRPHALYNTSQPSAPQTFQYDARGRLTSGDGREYTYTSFDLPRTITTSSGTTTFDYDAFGKRVKKWGPSGTTISLGDLYESREEVSGMRHVFVVPGSDGPIAQIIYQPAQKERSVHYLHQDALGSVSVTTAQGALVSRSYYEPFGARVDVSGNPVAGLTPDIRNGFTGHVHDDDLGLIHMRGRVYNPGTRRFLTADPFARLDDNPYSYVGHDPLNWIDPSGFEPEGPGRRFGAGASGFEFGFGADGFSGTAAYGGGAASGSDVVEQVLISMANAAAQFPRGNDAPNSSGCPQGTGTAPRPCAGAGNAGCPPGAGQMDRLQRVGGSRGEGVGAFLEGAFLGGFSDSDSWSTVVGSTAVGFIPVVGQIADIRDLAAAVMHVAEGEDGAWLELGASTLGVVPGLDFAKGMAKGATRAGKEALEGVVTRGVAELADNVPVPGHALAAAGGGARAIDPNRLTHIFGKAEHALDDFVAASGGREQAFTKIQEAANAALRDGRLPVGPNGILSSGDAGVIVDVSGTQIRLIGGRIVDGVVQIASASRRGLP